MAEEMSPELAAKVRKLFVHLIESGSPVSDFETHLEIRLALASMIGMFAEKLELMDSGVYCAAMHYLSTAPDSEIMAFQAIPAVSASTRFTMN